VPKIDQTFEVLPIEYQVLWVVIKSNDLGFLSSIFFRKVLSVYISFMELKFCKIIW